MKLNIVKDEHGKVIATFEHPAPGSPGLKPVLPPGHQVHEVDAPDNYKADLKALYEQHSR